MLLSLPRRLLLFVVLRLVLFRRLIIFIVLDLIIIVVVICIVIGLIMIRLLIIIHNLTRLRLCLIRIVVMVKSTPSYVCILFRRFLLRILRRFLRRRIRLLLCLLLFLVFFGPSIPYGGCPIFCQLRFD